MSESDFAMSYVDIVGYAAALAVLGSFCMSTIVPLRILAVVSNVLFGLYGVLAHLYPVFFLHSILLPINLFKLARCQPSAEPWLNRKMLAGFSTVRTLVRIIQTAAVC